MNHPLVKRAGKAPNDFRVHSYILHPSRLGQRIRALFSSKAKPPERNPVSLESAGGGDPHLADIVAGAPIGCVSEPPSILFRKKP